MTAAGPALAAGGAAPPAAPLPLFATLPVELALFALLLGVALVVALARDVLVATVVFGAYSLALSILWVVYRAPDVGLTEAAVGAGVTTSLFLVTLTETARPAGDRAFALDPDPRAAVAAAGFVAATLLTVPALPAVGDPDAPALSGAAQYYLDNTAGFDVTNVVTAILVVFRGFDTFGEIAVVFAAGVAVLVVLDREVP